MKNLILLSLLFISSNLFSQSNFDCLTAIEVSSFDSYLIKIDKNANGTESENTNESCEIPIQLGGGPDWETQTYWYKYPMPSDGCFSFVLSSTSDNYDIDFAVYKSESGSCDLLLLQRCMLSGESVGQSNNEPCIGPTGLMFGETDIAEEAGCSEGDNNFLAPLNVESGEVYYVAVKNFSNEDSILVEHDFVAPVSCVTSVSTSSERPEVQVYPNPVNNDLSFKFKDQNYLVKRLFIYDAKGTLQGEYIFHNNESVSIAHLANGLYTIQIISKAGISTHKIIKR